MMKSIFKLLSGAFAILRPKKRQFNSDVPTALGNLDADLARRMTEELRADQSWSVDQYLVNIERIIHEAIERGKREAWHPFLTNQGGGYPGPEVPKPSKKVRKAVIRAVRVKGFVWKDRTGFWAQGAGDNYDRISW